MDCEEKSALLALYLKRVQSLSRAVNTLHKARDEKWQKGFMMHWDAAHDALTACITAKNHLESHVSAHRCDQKLQIFEKAVA
jgi:hypothetical protein